MPWPVDDPPTPKLRTNLRVSKQQKLGEGTSAYFDGPLNVLIAMHRQQAAVVEVIKTAEAYDLMDPT